MDRALMPVAEEAPAQLEAGGAEAPAGDARQVVHIVGFAGRLLLLDSVLLLCLCCFYALITAFFFLGGAYIWFTTLTAIVLIGLLDFFAVRLRSQRISLRDHSIRRFMYGMPFTFFCFYSHSIISAHKDCSWYIAVENPSLRTSMLLVTYIGGCVGILSLALAALRIDCNGSRSVSRRVREGRWYALCHVLFRVTELSFRLGAGIFLCESLRALPWAHQVSPPIFLCIPFLCLVFLYALVFQFANHAGGKPSDDASCLVVGIVTLAMNPMHFLACPGYDMAVRKANKYLFLIRVLEAVVALGVVYATTAMTTPAVPPGLCKHGIRGADLIGTLGPGAMIQVIAGLAVHYLIMALHSEIQHSTCQALTVDQAEGAAPGAGMAFQKLNPAERSLRVAPPPADAGLCRAWVKLGGGLPLLPIAERMEPEQLDEYRIRSVLGGGAFGVVVRVEKVGEDGDGPPQTYAMKLLNTSGQQTLRLARREADIYSSIWLEMRELAPGYQRVGHPNIVRLHFWSSFEEGREFYIEDQGETRVVRHPSSRNTRFHMALMMEHCDTNLETYISRHHSIAADWFLVTVHFLAEILLALEYLHNANVAYRDLKPENVLIVQRPGTNPNVHCKLGDFGYGRMVDPQARTYDVSVAGTPYFCAPEMEARVRHVRLRAAQEEENALDVYSYGTVGYVLGTGPGYIQEADMGALGDRIDHPRCQTEGGDRCQACRGCQVLQGLRQQLLPLDPGGRLSELVGRCVAQRATERPSMAALRAERLFLFQETDFDALTRLEI